MTVREMQQRMGADEFHEWVEYYNVRPFGFRRDEQMHGDMMSSMWCLHGSAKAPEALRSPKHWMYSTTEDDGNLDPETEAAMMLAKIGG